jgi:hypothetical protein
VVPYGERWRGGVCRVEGKWRRGCAARHPLQGLRYKAYVARLRLQDLRQYLRYPAYVAGLTLLGLRHEAYVALQGLRCKAYGAMLQGLRC